MQIKEMKHKGFSLEMVTVKLVHDRELFSEEQINTPNEAVDLLGTYMADFDREVVFVLNLNSKCQIINASMVSMGSINEAMIHPREILKSSILSNATSIMLLHNHPSGNVEPSKCDKEVTERMKKCCDLLGISFLDHIIVGDSGKYYSFAVNREIDAKKCEKTLVAMKGR